MIQCPKCRTTNPDGARFCKACRAPIPNISEKIRCPNGHIMDPTWKDCPICRADTGSGRGLTTPSHEKTFMQSGNASLKVSGGPRRKTKVEGPVSEGVSAGAKKARRKTVVISPDQNGPKNNAIAKPRMVGFLVTYSHEPSGTYYEIREGRHMIGAGNVDISVKGDKNMSSEQAILLFRRGLFWMRDNLSTNGTFVNGEEITKDVTLNNYDKITMGDTEFTLIMIEPSKKAPQ